MTYMTNDRFIQRFIKKWGKWDFGTEHMEYKGNDIPITLICPIHGEFHITPHTLMRIGRCQKCGFDKRKITKTKPNQQYIEECIAIHGDKYDYSQTVYNGDRNITSAICHKKDKDGNEHGRFEFIASNHISKHHACGCPKCNGGVKLDREKVKCELQTKYPSYDFSEAIYSNCDTPMKIICPYHSVFYKTAYQLKQGFGCPKCKMTQLEKDICDFLDVSNIEYEYQQRFEWLGHQSLDFYLPDYNIAIECQGRQHFEAVSKYGGLEGLKKCIALDTVKNEKCHKNGVVLIYFTNKRTYDKVKRRNIEIPVFYDKLYTDKEDILKFLNEKL